MLDAGVVPEERELNIEANISYSRPTGYTLRYFSSLKILFPKICAIG